MTLYTTQTVSSTPERAFVLAQPQDGRPWHVPPGCNFTGPDSAERARKAAEDLQKRAEREAQS